MEWFWLEFYCVFRSVIPVRRCLVRRVSATGRIAMYFAEVNQTNYAVMIYNAIIYMKDNVVTMEMGKHVTIT